MKVPREKGRPRTVEEAQILLDQAIEDVDFDRAEEMTRELDDLQLLQDELNLSQVVSGYYEKKDTLSARLTCNYTTVELSANESIEATKTKYQYLFDRKCAEQSRELEDLFDAWRAARDGVRSLADLDFQQSMEVAKLIARDGRLKEAAQFRERSFHAKVVGSLHCNTALDSHYQRRAALMIERHKDELNPLIQERAQDINELTSRRDEQHGQGEQLWQVDNAGIVVGIRNSFKPTAKMPLSLAMQTVRPPPDPQDGTTFGNIGDDSNATSVTSGQVAECHSPIKRTNASTRPQRRFPLPRSARQSPRVPDPFREILAMP
jgi:hypothetical protein